MPTRFWGLTGLAVTATVGEQLNGENMSSVAKAIHSNEKIIRQPNPKVNSQINKTMFQQATLIKRASILTTRPMNGPSNERHQYKTML